MLAVSCGPLHTKIAQNVAHFHAADADEEREAALLALAELAKDISKSRVPELLAGIWRCGHFFRPTDVSRCSDAEPISISCTSASLILISLRSIRISYLATKRAI